MPSKPAAATPSPTRRRARPEDSRRAERRRDEIVQTAIRLFSEKGYNATSTKDIGDEIGLLSGSLYYYINSKEDLLYDILLDLHQFAIREVARIEAEGGDPLERLRRLVRNHVEQLDVSRTHLFDTEFHHLTGERHDTVLALRREYQNYVVRLIAEAQAEGLCDADINARLMASSILGFLNSIANWFQPERVSIEEMAEVVDRLVVGGLGAKRGRRRARKPPG
jgi:AcrR family transcriptional regulator